jgi:hypothetical protein
MPVQYIKLPTTLLSTWSTFWLPTSVQPGHQTSRLAQGPLLSPAVENAPAVLELNLSRAASLPTLPTELYHLAHSIGKNMPVLQCLLGSKLYIGKVSQPGV